jgi:uncharacterized protein (TIGR00369 family)
MSGCFTPADAGFAERVRASFARQRVMEFIGARMTTVEPGLVEIELPYRTELTQQHGFFHAGITGTIADSAGGYAGYTLFPADSSVLTIEYKMNLLAPADGERLVATGRVVRSGRTLTVCMLDVEVLKAGVASRCAFGTQTLICLKDRPDGPRAERADGPRERASG